MSLNAATVRKIALLARIRVPEESVTRLADELSNILGWIEQLDEVNTDNVAPMASVVEMRTAWRDDVVTDGDCQNQILANAPEMERGFFTVPKVVE